MTYRANPFQGGGMTRRRFARRLAVGAGAFGALMSMNIRPGSALSSGDVDGASGLVKVLVWEGYENPDAFKALGSVTIEAGYLAANEDTITKTQQAGAFDLMTIYQGMIDPLRKLGRIEPIDVSLLSNFEQLYPFFREADAFQRDGQVFAVPYTWGTMMVLYDAGKTSEPKSFGDLMNPALQGKIGMPDDAYAVITTFARYEGIDDANHLTRDQLARVMEKLRTFKPQLLSIAPSYGELPAMYQRGEILVSLPDWTPTAVAAGDAGVDVRSTIPAEGAFSFVDNWMAVAGAENPAGAYAVMNQAISAEAQGIIGVSTGLGIVNPGGVGALGDAVAKAWRYEQIEETFKQAPLYAGVPTDSEGDIATYEDWLAAWTDFKAA